MDDSGKSKPSGESPKRPAQPESNKNPYEPPMASALDTPVTFHSKDQSIAAEPWFNQKDFSSASNPDARLDILTIGGGEPAQLSEQELAEHSVWDELTTTGQLVAGPNAVTWFRYYQKQVSQTGILWTWVVTGVIVFMAGPLAILGAIINGYGGNALLMVVFFGPTIEEVLKIALPLWVVEKRPWLFSNSFQILLCGIGAGLTFAAIENWIYLNIYIPNASATLITWRWSVCVALHTGCSAIAAYGLVRVRQGMIRHGNRPQLQDGGHWIITAIVIHGLYNLIAIFLDGWFLNESA